MAGNCRSAGTRAQGASAALTGRPSRPGRRWTTLALAAATALAGLALPSAASAAPVAAASLSTDRERVIVVLAGGRLGAMSTSAAASDLSSEYDLQRRQTYSHLFSGFAASVPAERVDELRQDPAVAAVYPDSRIRASAGEVPPGVERMRADTVPGTKIGTGTAVDVDIALLDTGVNAHPDLTLAGGVNCASDAGCTLSSYADGQGHGTHVAGTAAAKDNGVGVVGTAPGARVWAVKVLGDSGGGSMSWFIAGLDWVVAKGGIEVVNASLGGGGSVGDATSAAVARATAAGVVVVVAAGNDNRDAISTAPANAPDAVTVSAYADTDGGPGGAGPAAFCTGTPDDTRAGFSNYGSVVDVAAPGVCITSTSRSGGYVAMSGTSMASPHVAGAAATYIAQRALPATPDRARLVREAFRSEWGAGQGSACGFGGGVTAEPLVIMGGCPTGGDTVPPSPVTVTARPEHVAVSLTWTAASDTSGISAYRVHRASGATGAFALRSSVAGSVTGFLDTGLVNGTLYRYVVTAVDGAGNATASATVSATPKDVTAPAAPTLTGVGHDRSAALTWTAPSDLSGIRAFQLWRALPGSSYALRTTTSGTARSFVDGGLVNGASYGYVVRAVDGAGNVSAASSVVSVTPVDDRAPSLVTPKVVRGDGRLTLTWPAASDSSGVRSYTVSRSVGTAAPLVVLTSVSGTTLQLVDPGLTNGTTYRYSVAATDVNGLTTTGDRIVSGTPADLTAPPPVVPTATASDSAVALSWPAASDVSGIGTYRVYRVVGTGSPSLVATVSGATTRWTAGGLAAGTSYRFQVVAVDTKGNASVPSTAVTATTPTTRVLASAVRWTSTATTTTTAPATATVALVSENGVVVAGAAVGLRLVNGGGTVVATGTAVSAANGVATLRATLVKGTSYRLQITSVTVTGRTWNGVTPANSITPG